MATGKVYYSTWQKASKVAIKLGITTVREYEIRYREDPKLPRSPHTMYADFPNWKIFLGKKKKPIYLSWRKAGQAAQKLGIRTQSDYYYEGRYKLDPLLPSAPDVRYKDFPGWGIFLGGSPFVRRRTIKKTKQNFMKPAWEFIKAELLALGATDDVIHLFETNQELHKKMAYLVMAEVEPIFKHIEPLSVDVVVDYNESFEQMVFDGKYDYCVIDILAKNFKVCGSGINKVKVEFLVFNCDEVSLESINISLRASKMGYYYRPIKPEELLALGKKYPEIQTLFPVVALGDKQHLVIGAEYDGMKDNKTFWSRYIKLHSHCHQFTRACRFGVVREPIK